MCREVEIYASAESLHPPPPPVGCRCTLAPNHPPLPLVLNHHALSGMKVFHTGILCIYNGLLALYDGVPRILRRHAAIE